MWERLVLLGSPSSAGTIPAFTVGGTISGGGNQLNNIIIGTSTPLAGNFTAVTDTSEVITGGTLASGANVFNITATQSATAATQTAVLIGITSGASGVDTTAHVGFQVNFAAGFTGVGQSSAGNFANTAAGTGITTVPASGSNTQILNSGSAGNAAASTAGHNAGVVGKATGSTVLNTGVLGLAQINTTTSLNVGGFFSAIAATNNIGVFASLNQTTLPTVSAALVADVGSQSQPIALWRAAAATVASVNVTGGLTATLTNVATTSAVCYAVGTNGLLSYDGTIGTCTVSDERLKNMGERIPNALERLLKINGVYYTWKDQKLYGAGRQIGVGAQTVEKAFPELVHTDSIGHKSADYQRLSAPIIEAIRELELRLTKLEKK